MQPLQLLSRVFGSSHGGAVCGEGGLSIPKEIQNTVTETEGAVRKQGCAWMQVKREGDVVQGQRDG